jgi:hypothetical protein
MTIAEEEKRGKRKSERGERRSERGGVGDEAWDERCIPIRGNCDYSRSRFSSSARRSLIATALAFCGRGRRIQILRAEVEVGARGPIKRHRALCGHKELRESKSECGAVGVARLVHERDRARFRRGESESMADAGPSKCRALAALSRA